jgi:hypothetical protein
MIDGIRENLARLREDMNRQFSDCRDDTNRRFDAADRRSALLDAKLSRQSVWLVGLQVMSLAAVVTSVATILSAISGR